MKMNVKKCDRCGKVYKENKAHKTGYRIVGETITGVAITTTSGCYDITLDLCDDCITDLKKWMNQWMNQGANGTE